jgi:glycosyltransferase involved in cell wall biosynthesis
MLTGDFRRKREESVMMLNDAFAGKFRLLGRLPYKDVLRFYSRSRAVLVPSLCEEPLPYVVVEAIAMGTLPIASRVGGIPEIVGEHLLRRCYLKQAMLAVSQIKWGRC